MTMIILGGNQRKAERIARDIVKDLTPMDIDFTIGEAMGLEGEQRLCSAIDEEISATLNDDTNALLNEYDDLRLSVSIARQRAGFALGYAAALRLLGIDEKPKGKTRR